jgi:hypothetical protein
VERLLAPGGVLIFDDIYWSHGMLAAWKHIVLQERFRITVDLSWQGLALIGSGIERRLRDAPARKVHFDVCDYVLPDDLQPEARQQGEEPGIRVQHAEAGIDADR